MEYLTPAETDRFFAVMAGWPNQEVCRMLKLAFFTAMRKGEIFALKTGDLDFNFGVITIRAPKGGKTASIPMNQAAREILETQIMWRDSNQPGGEYIFPGKDGQKRRECSAVDRVKAAAQRPKDFRIFHGLRHHYAVMLANSGKFTLDMLAEMLTHKSTVMTKRYGQFLPETMRVAGNLAESILHASIR